MCAMPDEKATNKRKIESKDPIEPEKNLVVWVQILAIFTGPGNYLGPFLI